MSATLYYVDILKYIEVYGGQEGRSRRFDYAHDWEIMALTPLQLKDCIEHCIPVKQIV